ncbi:Holliday junction branch migration protein RuvA [Microbulbifer thermotolerans]|uniref:Holliday junction branch migration complex subunit RuvA n=1 Tax=Microbulbifer thermotolerans TaxID=252514 RepID=A0A143HJV0_MICTH|nr:Holliday junction branch migration protein RuvA [Microbulbifer thermotolerans]AMX01750.1 Holliday junction DNA helicase RuvA [Microbulbifer thermotolerans]MCX2779523.1 Holliday junction branch migration protein RuvA [Microbulbifer thermotolerans]MCX2783359.1 Holliday junction branch migration protein RuvA [Microbulbifer thermotolerans]MCX2793395.1 Holliday junction branch migration protein RuvA [Microbulbifer thermotolerans]MCX2801336.1 Holliday junction branch migration protein RuvA [Micro
MIGRLSGTLAAVQPPLLLVDVQGVGYEVLAPMTTVFELPPQGQQVQLHTHLAVSETAQTLYGFLREADRQLFRTLIKVNGVGPKMALAILSGLDAAALSRCVAEDNVAALVKVPGVGKKTAERLIVELRDKLAPHPGEVNDIPLMAAAAPKVDHLAEAESALAALGYKPTEASKMVARASKAQPDADSATLIRLALKSIAPA